MTQVFAAGKQVWDKTFGSALTLVLVGLIRSYQILLSPRIGQVCRYYPSCSHYGLAAVKVHGAGKGSLLAALAAHWVDQQLQIPPPLKPQARPIRRLPGPLR